jgi:hypothetical protein
MYSSNWFRRLNVLRGIKPLSSLAVAGVLVFLSDIKANLSTAMAIDRAFTTLMIGRY